MAQWEVAKTLGVCADCGQTLAPKQEYYAVLVEQAGKLQASPEGPEEKAAGFERRDYCESCWERLRPQAFCFWKTHLPEPQEKKKLLLDDVVLLDIFERLAGTSEQPKINFRFVLALILMRKRLLKYQQTDYRDGQEFWIMSRPGEQTKYEVLNPRLDDAQIKEVAEQLSTILRSEL